MKTIEQLTTPITGWWITADEEHYTGGPFDTREDAIHAAREDGHADAFARCTQQPIRLSEEFDAEDWINGVEENHDEWSNEDGDPALELSADQLADLQSTVRAAIDAWQVKHQLAPIPSQFAEVEDFECLPEGEERE